MLLVMRIAVVGVVLIGIAAITAGASEPPRSREAAEVVRLQMELDKLNGRLSKCRKEVRANHAKIEQLEKENRKLRRAANPQALEYAQSRASRLLKSYVKSLEGYLLRTGAEKYNIDYVYVLLYSALLDWKGEDEGRAVFASKTIAWLEPKIQLLWAKAEERMHLAEAAILGSPGGVKDALKGLSKGDAAKVIGGLQGQTVTWTGIVTDVVDNMFMEHELEMDCGGIMVDVDIAESSMTTLRRVRLGTTVQISGAIATIDNFGLFGVRIGLVECRVRLKK